jgi:DHA1 family multidrug resistance protein-like MFS transporter
MKDIIRDSTIGQLIRFVTRNKVLHYVEESADFQCPRCYADSKSEEKTVPLVDDTHNEPQSSSASGTKAAEGDLEEQASTKDVENQPLEKVYTGVGLWKIPTQAELQQKYSAGAERTVSRPIQAKKTSDGTILVDWYTTGRFHILLKNSADFPNR